MPVIATMAGKQSYCSFTAAEKLTVIEEEEKTGNRAVPRRYDVLESSVRMWRKQKEKSLGASRQRRSFRGKKAQFPQVEKEMVTFLHDPRAKGCAVSMEKVQLKAREVAKTLGVPLGFQIHEEGWSFHYEEDNNFTSSKRL